MMKLLDATSRVAVPGIQNLGNTCFFNAILQSLASVASFQEYLQEIERSARATSHDIPFTRALRDCLEALAPREQKEPRAPIVPRTLNAELVHKLSTFRGNKQQDSQELLQFLVNIVTDEQRRCAVQDRGLCFLVNQSFDDEGSQSISDLRRMQALDERNWNPLYGLQVNLLQCAKCGDYRPITNQPFLDVSLSFGAAGASGKPQRLTDCLKMYTESEVIQGVECSHCSIEEELKLTQREYALAAEQLKRMSSKDAVNAVALEISQYERQDWIHTLEKLLAAEDPVSIDSLEREIPRSRQDCHKRMQFSRSPDIFCFHFNRKVYNAWSGSARKLETYVEFPLELDMSPFCEYEVGADAKQKRMNGYARQSGLRQRMALGRQSKTSASSSSSSSSSSPLLSPSIPFAAAQQRRQQSPPSLKDPKEAHHLMYDLSAVILHHGNERGGHFTAFRRTMPTNQWFFISDDVVREVSVDEVLRSCAYMLFYERKHRAKRASRTSETETDDDDSLPDVPFEHQLVSGGAPLY